MPQPEKYSKTAWVFSKMLDITSSTEKIEILPLRKEKNIMLFMSLIAIVQNLVISHNFWFSIFTIHLSSKIKRARHKDILILTAVKTKFPHINYDGPQMWQRCQSNYQAKPYLCQGYRYTWSTELKINNWRIYLSKALGRSDSEDLMEEK